jgi:hypothetical protein
MRFLFLFIIVPLVLKCCADFIEAHGIVDGIYRLSGVTSNIQRLRYSLLLVFIFSESLKLIAHFDNQL